MISFSPLMVPTTSGPPLVLVRRDLFDARFQLVSRASGGQADEADDETHPILQKDTAASVEALQFVDAPSDLVKGVYEGGLKTWECSVDLAGYLHDHTGAWKNQNSKTRRSLEVFARLKFISNSHSNHTDRLWYRNTLYDGVTSLPASGRCRASSYRNTSARLQPLCARACDRS
jgi:hypothetical protein